MAESEVAVQGQKCQVCYDEEIRWKCFTCDQYMCDHCKKMHQQVRTNKNHRVSIVRVVDQREYDPKCNIHPDEDITLFCKECDALICTDCIVSSSHKHHTILKINHVIREKQSELFAVIRESTHKLFEFEHNMKSIKELGLNQSNDIAKCYEDVVSKYKQLKDKVYQIDLIYKDILITLKELEEQNKESLAKTEKSIENEMSELRQMIIQCEEIQTDRKIGLIQFVQNVKQKLRQFKPHPPPYSIDVPVFVSSDIVEIEAKDLFGHLVINKGKGTKHGEPAPAIPILQTIHVSKETKNRAPVPEMPIAPTINISKGPEYGEPVPAMPILQTIHVSKEPENRAPVPEMPIAPTINISKGPEYGGPVPATTFTPTINVKVVSSFNMYTNNVKAVNKNKAWVIPAGTSLGDKTIQLLTSDGKVSKKVKTDFEVYDLGVTKSGELLAIVYSGNKVKKLTSSGRFMDLYEDPDRAFTRGITVTDKNDIIVCLHSHKANIEEGHLVQLTSNGHLKTTIKHDTDGKTLLFADPFSVSSNRNNDIIVIDNKKKKVVVVDKSGNRRFIYSGKVRGMKKSFNPAYTVTDQYGHVIISDMNNSIVHLLDKDGSFIQFILSAENGLQSPNALSVDTAGRLWVGSSGNKKIMVVKYV